MENRTYIFNPFYTLKNDKNRIILLNTPSFDVPDKLADDSIELFINPVFAIIFANFNGKKSYKEILYDLEKIFQIGKNEIKKFVKPFINNKERIVVEYDGTKLEFPKNILIDMKDDYILRNLKFDNFIIDNELDLVTYRHNSPTSISLLINTVCVTDCIYCYVDRRKKMKAQLSLSKIINLIQEAKKIGVVDFDISGTEFFLYKNWYEVLRELLKNNYLPYLTTKIPLKEQDILKLKKLNIKDLQLSIDTNNIKIAKKVNRVLDNNYTKKMFETLKVLNSNNINVVINTVLTNINGSPKQVKELLDELNKYKIARISLNPAERSDYWRSEDFDRDKLTGKQISELEEFIEIIKNNYNFEIIMTGFADKNIIEGNFKVKKLNFNNRSFCSANMSKMSILTDGKVTICEELYWNPNFIIGDVNNQSLMEIWNSDKALKLAGLEREIFSDDSVCKTCKEFENCRLGKGVCWSEVAEAYGQENWDFPSPVCPYAPKPLYSIHHD